MRSLTHGVAGHHKDFVHGGSWRAWGFPPDRHRSAGGLHGLPTLHGIVLFSLKLGVSHPPKRRRQNPRASRSRRTSSSSRLISSARSLSASARRRSSSARALSRSRLSRKVLSACSVSSRRPSKRPSSRWSPAGFSVHAWMVTPRRVPRPWRTPMRSTAHAF